LSYFCIDRDVSERGGFGAFFRKFLQQKIGFIPQMGALKIKKKEKKMA
jgi:hypothetical protein